MTCEYCGRLVSECEQRLCPPARQNHLISLALALAVEPWANEDTL